MSLVGNEDFQHILRVLNTNVDGKQKIMFVLTPIKGIGRRLANIVCKKADIDMNKRWSFWINGGFTYIIVTKSEFESSSARGSLGQNWQKFEKSGINDDLITSFETFKKMRPLK